MCIVSDGRSKINSRTLSLIAAMGVYQDGVAKNVVNDKQVVSTSFFVMVLLSLPPLFSRLHIYTSTPLRSPSHQNSALRVRSEVLVPFRLSSVSRRRIRRKLIPIVGSSTLLVLSFNQTSVFFLMSELCPAPLPSTICGRHSISIPMLVVRAEKSLPSKGNTASIS